MAVTRQQLEQQLVAAHRTKNVQAAQQAAYAIRAYDQNVLSAQVPSINTPPPIDRVPKPTFGSWLENVTTGIGEGLGEQVQGLGGAIQRGVTAFAQDPLKASAAAFMTALEPARQGFTQPVQATKDIGTGIVETGKQMYQQATSGPVGLGQTIGQMIDLPGPSLPGGKRRPTMAELDVYHGTPHTFEPEEGAPLGKFRSQKIGTGEGAQVYGYGLYLAEAPGTAKTYQAQLSADNYKNAATGEMIQSGRAWQDATKAVQNAGIAHPDRAGQIATNIQDWVDKGRVARSFLLRNQVPENLIPAYEAAIDSFENLRKNKGRLYKVDLPDSKIEQMLDWDKPLAEQPELVRKAIADVGVTPESLGKTAADKVRRLAQAEGVADWAKRDLLADAARLESAKSIQQIIGTLKNMQLDYGINPDSGPFASSAKDFLALVRATEYLPNGDTGASAYRLLSALRGGDAAASEYMRSLGVPGIKYLDAGSRGSEKGTRNFVVFPGEEQNLTILERDGVKAEVPKAAAPKPRAAPQYNFAKESQRVSNLVNAENVTLDDYDPPKKKFNKTYAQPGQTYGSNTVENFVLEREFENGTYIRVNVGADREFFGDMPDDLYDPEDPPLMYGSSIEQGGGDYDTPAPTGKGALTQMTLEALEIAKQNKGGWVSEMWLSEESVKKYERLIAAGVPFRKEGKTYYILPQDLARVDLGKASDALNKKYSGK